MPGQATLSRSARRTTLIDEDTAPIDVWRRRWCMCCLPRASEDEQALLDLDDSVGREDRNRRRDVARVQLLLDRVGDFDLEATAGPTGYYDPALEAAIRSFQRRYGLVVDGRVSPQGPTHAVLKARWQTLCSGEAAAGRHGNPQHDETCHG